MNIIKRIKFITLEQKKKIFLYNFSQKIAGNQTFFHRFWPVFQVVSPIFLGYIVFGNLLEQATGEVPFRIWVSTGAVVWLLFLCVLYSGSKIFSNKTRRQRFLLYGPTFWTQVTSTFIQYFLVLIPLTFYEFYYIFSNQTLFLSLAKFFLTSVFIVLIIPIMQTVVIFVGLSCAFFKDFKMLIPFLAQVLLFVSPVFFQTPSPDSIPEKVLSRINPLIPLLDIYRRIVLAESDLVNWNLLIIFFVSTMCYFLNSRFLSGFTITILGNLNNGNLYSTEADD